MGLLNRIRVQRVAEEWQRRQALSVLRATYVDEKGWVGDAEQVFPAAELGEAGVSWFLALRGLEPAGVLRVLYELSLAQYAHYELRPVGVGLVLQHLLRRARVAEVGRFAVVPAYRRNLLVAAELFRAASLETFQRGYTHYLTDIFEGERHSPYLFHTRVLGFRAIATHDTGELNYPSRRITMLLDLESAHRRLCTSRGWIYRYLRRALATAEAPAPAGEAPSRDRREVLGATPTVVVPVAAGS